MNFVVVCLLIYCAVREYLYQKMTRQLIDRIMSGSYANFKLSENFGRIKEETKEPKFPKLDESDIEDFGTLSDY